MGVAGCNCCESCNICSDSATRADDSDINANGGGCGGGWTTISGGASISSNYIHLTSSSTLIYSGAGTDSTTVGHRIKVTAKSSASGNQLIIGLRYNPSSGDYLYARITFGTLVEIVQHSSGVDTVLESLAHGTLTNLDYVFEFFYGHHSLTLAQDGNFLISALFSCAASATDIYGVIGTQAISSGSIDIKTISMDYTYDFGKLTCPTWPTDRCYICWSYVPEFFQLDISGVSTPMGGCADCSPFNGTFILAFRGLNGTARCNWDYDIPGSPCDGDSCLYLTLGASTPPDMFLSLQIRYGCSGGVIGGIAGLTFTEDHSWPHSMDCENLVGISLTPIAYPYCDFTGATITLTAL